MTRTHRGLTTFALAAAVASYAAVPARAEGPVEGGDVEQQVKELALKISRALKENEAHLARLARGEQGAPTDVDIKLPDGGSGSTGTKAPAGGESGSDGGTKGGSEGEGSGKGAGGSASEGMKELLDNASRTGKSAADGIGELLRLAQSMGNQGGGGGGEHSDKPSPGEGEEKDPGKKENDPKSGAPEEEKKDEPGGSDPKDGPKKDDPVPPGTRPPTSDKAPPTAKDLEGVFFVRLPAKVREAIRNGDFDRVPEKYRAMVAEWTRLLSEQDAEDAKNE